MFFNPAYAGSHGYGEGSALIHYRNQWLGLDGAPTTLMFGGEASLFENKVGLGMGVSRETLGVMSNTDINANAAYRIQLNKGYLAGGLRVGYTLYNNNFDLLKIKDPSDVFDNNGYDVSAFTVGAGMYYNNDGLYVGLSVPTLARVVSSKNGVGDRKRHVYFHTGFMIGDEYATIKIEPALLVKYEYSVPLQFTIGANVWLTNDFAIGGHYRSSDALALSTEIHFKQNYRFALAYDFTLSDINRYSNGSIEALFGYRFNNSPNNPKVKSLRHGGRF